MPKLSDLPNKLAAATKQGAGGRGEASRIRRAVLAQLLGVLGHRAMNPPVKSLVQFHVHSLYSDFFADAALLRQQSASDLSH